MITQAERMIDNVSYEKSIIRGRGKSATALNLLMKSFIVPNNE